MTQTKSYLNSTKATTSECPDTTMSRPRKNLLLTDVMLVSKDSFRNPTRSLRGTQLRMLVNFGRIQILELMTPHSHGPIMDSKLNQMHLQRACHGSVHQKWGRAFRINHLYGVTMANLCHMESTKEVLAPAGSSQHFPLWLKSLTESRS